MLFLDQCDCICHSFTLTIYFSFQPDGYHKKFRKTRKKKTGEDDSESEYETDSGDE